MKLALYCTACLVTAVFAAGAIGYAPTLTRWGESGVQSMIAVAVICLLAAIIAIIPMVIVAPRWPEQVGPAILAGLGIRLMLTIAALVGYQILAKPHMASFMLWATIFYALVLAIDTTFGVVAIRRFYPQAPRIEGKAT